VRPSSMMSPIMHSGRQRTTLCDKLRLTPVPDKTNLSLWIFLLLFKNW